MKQLELTSEERQALLRLIESALQEPKYPLSPELEALRAIGREAPGSLCSRR